MLKINYRELSNSKGYKSLKKAAILDCQKGNKCFNVNGCNKKPNKCSHYYCDEFKWVIDRAKHYSHITNISIIDILNAWENTRTYSWNNFYQEYNQPKLTNKKQIIIIDNLKEYQEKYGQEGYICSACNKVQKNPYECVFCKWKTYGLLKNGVFLFVKDKARGERIFMPLAYKKSIG